MDSDEESPSKRVKTGGNEKSGNTPTTAPSSNETNSNSNSNYPRRLVSVFSSNQAIHKLTDKIIRSQQQQEQQEKEKQEKEKQEKEKQQSVVHSNLRKDSDEIEMTESNAINPNIDYPHQRHFCGLYKFEKNNSNYNSLLFCQKCYCYVCNIPAQDCQSWSLHCNADDSLEWKEQRRFHAASNARIAAAAAAVNNATTATAVVNNADGNHVILLDDSSDDDTHTNTRNNNNNNADPKPQDSDKKINMQDDDDSWQDDQNEQHLLRRVQAMHNHNYNHHFDPAGPAGTDKDMIGQKARKDARIPEVLAHNLRQISNLAISNSSTSNRSSTSTTRAGTTGSTGSTGSTGTGTGNNHKMEGDVPQLNLHNSFFVEGVRIGWPYPAIMPPQRLMAIHLTKAFKNKRHVVIESPTGTG